jgi:SAM-dependent methyltransferase
MLPLLYHAHHSRHLEDLPFWESLARRQGGPVLELGCGSGRVLLPLARLGYPVTGLEQDAGMLRLLRENTPPELAGRVQLVQADMSAFGFGRIFSLILLPCNTFSTLSARQRLDTLRCVRRSLAPQGLFAASLPNPALLQRLPPRSEPELEESFPHPLDGEPVQVSSGWERTRDRLTIHWHYDHLLPDGRVERFSMQASHALVPVEAYLEEMRSAGLNPAELYGDFDGSPYTPEAPALIIIAD